jgi:hypothetical protein
MIVASAEESSSAVLCNIQRKVWFSKMIYGSIDFDSPFFILGTGNLQG